MLQAPAKHKHTNYHFPFTGDESWTFYAYDHRTRWGASWDDVDEIERPSHLHQKTMFTVFFNGTGEYKILIPPDGQKVNSEYFIESVLHPLAEICHPQGRGHVKGKPCCILTIRRFTALRECERIWQVFDS
jgi:hypothetical protein